MRPLKYATSKTTASQAVSLDFDAKIKLIVIWQGWVIPRMNFFLIIPNIKYIIYSYIYFNLFIIMNCYYYILCDFFYIYRDHVFYVF